MAGPAHHAADPLLGRGQRRLAAAAQHRARCWKFLRDGRGAASRRRAGHASAAGACRPGRPRAASPRPYAANEETLFDEHPTLWRSAGALFWGIVLTPILIGIPILIHVFWSRSRTRYRVTNRRVMIETGIFTRNSRELRIEDIRSIAARANMFGIGDIEFSTAARDDAEVTFWGLSHVERVRDLVKQQQNQLR